MRLSPSVRRFGRWLSRDPRPAPRRPRRPLRLEALEERAVPATLDPATGVLSINGTSYDDTIRIRTVYTNYPESNIEVRETLRTNTLGPTTTTYTFARTDVRSIVLTAQSGNDTLQFDSLRSPIPVDINMGSGNDTVRLGQYESRFDAVNVASITIRGEGTFSTPAMDYLYVYDQNWPNRNYTITSDSIAEADNDPVTQPVYFYGMDYVELNAGYEANTVEVRGTPPVFSSGNPAWDGVQLRVNGWSGDDTVQVGNANLDLDAVISGALEVNGEDGNDRLTLRDDASQTWTNYTITSSRVRHNLIPDVRYSAENLTLYSGWRDNWVTLEESAYYLWVTLDTGGGYDTIDSANVEENWWHLTGSKVGYINNTFDFNNVEYLYGGEGKDTFYVYDAAAGMWLDASSGENVLDYSPSTLGATINLTTHTASRTTGAWGFRDVIGSSGADTITGDSQDNLLRGGTGRDILRGEAGADILLGEAGNDDLYGSWGRDLMIGGVGADYLDGGADDDLLVAGTTDRDNDPAALRNIHAAWRSGRDFGQRVGDIRPMWTVSYDRQRDSLLGGNEYDWCWGDPTYTIGTGPFTQIIWADNLLDTPEQLR